MCYLPLCYISQKAVYDASSYCTTVFTRGIISLHVLCSGTGSVLFGAWHLYGGAGRLHYKYTYFTAVVVVAGVCAVHFRWGQGASVVLRRAVQEVRYS